MNETWHTTWDFELSTEAPGYFWNRVVAYVSRHERRLDTERYGPLLLMVPGNLARPDPDIIEEHHTVLGWRLDTVTPETQPTDAQVVAFLDPQSGDPAMLPLPGKAPVFWCSMMPIGAHRVHLRLRTRLPEATAYVTAMLDALIGEFPEMAGVAAQREPRPALADDDLGCIPDERDRTIVRL